MNPNIIHVEFNNDEIIKKVLTNTIKMLTERGHLSSDKLKDNIVKITNIQSDDFTYTVQLDNPINKLKKVIIRIIQQTITSISKTSGVVSDFLTSNKDTYKILIVKSINTKSRQMVSNYYQNSEIFLESELMINLIDHELIPKIYVLSDSDKETFFAKHMCKKKNMPKISRNDPLSRYYNLRPRDIVRIIRPSETSGYVASYRLITV